MYSKLEKHKHRALPFEDLIAGPISAMITAQSYSAHATYQYITSLMNNSDDNTLSPKMLEIMISRMMQLSKNDNNIDNNNDNGKEDNSIDSGFVEKKQLLKIPLLSLLPIPYISIDNAEINFNVDIIHHETQNDTVNYKIESKKKKIAFFTPPVKMYATFVSNNESINETKSHLSVKIKIKQQELPLGLEKYLQILGNSITAKDVK